METWDHVDNKNHPLQRIGQLTIRLLRLSMHEQLLRGKEQLRAQGLILDLPKSKDFTNKKEPKIYAGLDIVEKENWK